MPETRSKIKDYLAIVISIIAILGALGTYGSMQAKNAVLQDTVRRHEETLKKYNIPVMHDDLKDMAEDVEEIKNMAEKIYDWMLSQ